MFWGLRVGGDEEEYSGSLVVRGSGMLENLVDALRSSFGWSSELLVCTKSWRIW